MAGRRPDWERAGFEAYVARLPHHVRLELVELPLEKAGRNRAPLRARELEGERLLKGIPAQAYKVALDERGRALSSRVFAERLERWQQHASHIAFIIGGPDGLSAPVLKAAQETLSLSSLTLPHGLVRVVLAEQIYRAFTILDGHPYHRD